MLINKIQGQMDLQQNSNRFEEYLPLILFKLSQKKKVEQGGGGKEGREGEKKWEEHSQSPFWNIVCL